MSELQRLRDRVLELEDALGLTAEIPYPLVPQHTGMTKSLAKLFCLLIHRPFVSRDAAYTVLFGGRPECDQPAGKIIEPMVCNLRKTLRRYDISIETRWGMGYYMTDENKRKVHGLKETL